MGYWGSGLFDNDHTMDWVDGEAASLRKRLLADDVEISDFYSAAIFIRGVEHLCSLEDRRLPLTVSELVDKFVQLAPALTAGLTEDYEFRQVITDNLSIIKQFVGK